MDKLNRPFNNAKQTLKNTKDIETILNGGGIISLNSSKVIDDIVAEPTKGINPLLINITTNTKDITDNQSKINELDTKIFLNRQIIDLNYANSLEIDKDVIKNKEDIATNKNNIDTNTSNITTNKNDIAELENDIDTNKNNINTNTLDIIANSNDIATNKNNIDTNTSNITTNKNDIDLNALNITTKQNKLIAGDNISIVGDTISASGGGSGEVWKSISLTKVSGNKLTSTTHFPAFSKIKLDGTITLHNSSGSTKIYFYDKIFDFEKHGSYLCENFATDDTKLYGRIELNPKGNYIYVYGYPYSDSGSKAGEIENFSSFHVEVVWK